MTSTISKVDRGATDNNALLRKWCDLAAAAGGSFSITSHYETGSCWFNVYTINWPGKQAWHQDGTTDSAKTTTASSVRGSQTGLVQEKNLGEGS